MQALQDGGYYGALANLPDITSKLVAKQMNHLEDIMADLRASLYVSDFILHVSFPLISLYKTHILSSHQRSTSSMVTFERPT